MRLDLFLDRICLFKTRSAASKAIDTGRVTVDGAAAKRSQTVHIDAVIEIDRSNATVGERRLRLRVVQVPAGSVSKRDARDYYDVMNDTADDGAPDDSF